MVSTLDFDPTFDVDMSRRFVELDRPLVAFQKSLKKAHDQFMALIDASESLIELEKNKFGDVSGWKVDSKTIFKNVSKIFQLIESAEKAYRARYLDDKNSVRRDAARSLVEFVLAAPQRFIIFESRENIENERDNIYRMIPLFHIVASTFSELRKRDIDVFFKSSILRLVEFSAERRIGKSDKELSGIIENSFCEMACREFSKCKDVFKMPVDKEKWSSSWDVHSVVVSKPKEIYYPVENESIKLWTKDDLFIRFYGGYEFKSYIFDGYDKNYDETPFLAREYSTFKKRNSFQGLSTLQRRFSNLIDVYHGRMKHFSLHSDYAPDSFTVFCRRIITTDSVPDDLP